MPSTPVPTHADTLKTALDERRPLLLAMREEDIERQPKVDASVAAEAVIGQAPQIEQYREALVARFGDEAGTLVDELVVVAHATKQADVELSAAAASSDLTAMEVELRAEHQLLFTDAQSLVNRKLLDAQRLEPARGALGYRQLIHTTLVLVSLLREKWSEISGSTPITEADLDRVEAKAQRMLTVLGEREKGSTRMPALELRVRALSALIRHYDEVRRMITFLRWREGDADEIAPSLYTRKPGRRQQDDEVDTPPTSDRPLVTTPTTVTTPAVSSNGAPLSPFVT
jgi:hypothetical protein